MLSKSPLIAKPVMKPMLRNMSATDIIDPLNPGTCSRTKLRKPVAHIPKVNVPAVHSATETSKLGTKLKVNAKSPETNVIVMAKVFLPTRLTTVQPVNAPAKPPTAEIDE